MNDVVKINAMYTTFGWLNRNHFFIFFSPSMILREKTNIKSDMVLNDSRIIIVIKKKN